MRKIVLISFVFLIFSQLIFCLEYFDELQEKFDSEKYVLSWYMDVLKTKDRESIHKYSSSYFDIKWQDMDGDHIAKWTDTFEVAPIDLFISERHSQEAVEIGYKHIFLISKIKKMDNFVYYLSGNEYKRYNMQSDEYCPIDWMPVRNFDEFTFIFVFEGDYLNIYYNKINESHLFAIYCRIDDATLKEFKSLIETNTCDLSRVTFPRRADKNHSVGTSCIVAENLRLRKEESTSSVTLQTMQTGTSVKILQFGKKQTIDGITANWVQVELDDGTKGWCFGGYLVGK